VGLNESKPESKSKPAVNIWRCRNMACYSPHSPCSLNPARTLPSNFTLNRYSTMLSLRDPSPCLAQATPSIFPPSSSPPCKEEPSTPHRRLLSPLQNAINSLPTTDTVAVKTEDDSTDIGNTMERRNEAGGSQSRSNNQYVYSA